jgi:hypothetical protein
MSTAINLSSFSRRVRLFNALALAAVLGAGAAILTSTASAQTATAATVTAQPAASFSLQAQQPAYSSSSDENAAPAPTTEALNVKPFNFVDAMQYGAGRRGGRPRYRGGNTNPDGSNKYIFFGGAGFTQPIGNTWHYFTPSYGFQVGGGRQFSKKFAVPIQFDYDNFGLTGQTLANQEAIYSAIATQYNNVPANGCSVANPQNCATAPNPLDGNAHVWSFTIDPTETFYQTDTWGAYAVEGVGFYHKVTNFTTPETGYEEDAYGDLYEYSANAIIDHYTSNAAGFNGGLGLTYRFSRFSNERFYGEARYVFIPNSQRHGITVANVNSSQNNYLVANDFPANSNRTSYFPVKFGIRF